MDEWHKLLESLPKGLIYVLMSNSEIREDNSYKSIGVRIDFSGKIILLYNADFWQRCSFAEKRFCLVHEALHILLDHWTRLSPTRESNMAADLVVNHLAVNIYKIIDRAEIGFERELCWVDTVFRRHRVDVDGTYEYYYDKVMSLPRVNVKHTLDDHHFDIDRNGLNVLKERVQAAAKRIEIDEAIEDLDQNLLEKFLMIEVNWSSILKTIFGRYRPGTALHWLHNKRLDSVLGDLMLPSEISDIEVPSVNAVIYVDTSKSCTNYVHGFMRSVRYIPKHINYSIKGFCGRVYDIDKRVPKLYTGVTSFSAIEKSLRKLPVYPDSVVVLTDGAGDTVKPKFPKRWTWVLVKPYTMFIPPESRIVKAYVQ